MRAVIKRYYRRLMRRGRTVLDEGAVLTDVQVAVMYENLWDEAQRRRLVDDAGRAAVRPPIKEQP